MAKKSKGYKKRQINFKISKLSFFQFLVFFHFCNFIFKLYAKFNKLLIKHNKELKI
jgi:hypothetical protein